MSREKLIEIARINKEHSLNGTIELEDGIFEVPAKNYFDRDRWQQEVDLIFKRVPLVLGLSAEIPNIGDYKAIEVVGVPVVITRDNKGEVRAFLNACPHRGAQLKEVGLGNSTYFSCPYHGWTFNDDGSLRGIATPKDFGDADKLCLDLISLPASEKAGIIWVTLNPNSDLNIDSFLSGYDKMLSNFGLENWHIFNYRTLKGPNWKVAYDGYLDLYHIPVLHKDTFGDNFSNRAMYYNWGPHQKVISPYRLPQQDNFEPEGLPSEKDYFDKPFEEWPMSVLMAGVWTIFPHISIASFTGGGRSIMLSQLFPGDKPEDSITHQYYLMEKKPNKKQAKEAHEQFKLLKYVVEIEDYKTGINLQKSLKTGMIKSVKFGRNEGGGRRFHKWVDQLLNTEDKNLTSLF
ncbi:MAG: hypothetical protein CML87_02460 [Rhodobiaceae bacterium]|jgi:phenylpropionate dioxygenase-like ring-hydroxylating dioxygenase large terminal subunit|nr:hypothetical protein [Rhodobiaceae bacterium]|tara:strand:- start:3034 stop:4242 length:1209 start_codon:yes stop_codon:yes gene_type:complete